MLYHAKAYNIINRIFVVRGKAYVYAKSNQL